ncbi:MAG: flagellar hook-basal body complex protein FliE [Eubacteriales bacterium]|nr:flagellar hook-basal body complex protein FliE [Eubacteriales bacterium]
MKEEGLNMFIVPMNSNINNSMFPVKTTDPNVNGNEGLQFKEFLLDLVHNVEETEAVTGMDAYNLSIGNMDDMHTMLINATKAEIAVQTMVQLRNKLLDSYSEIMRINL